MAPPFPVILFFVTHLGHIGRFSPFYSSVLKSAFVVNLPKWVIDSRISDALYSHSITLPV